MNPGANPPEPHLIARPMGPLDSGFSEEKLDILEYWRCVHKRWKQILALAVVFGLVSGAMTSTVPPTYRASTTILVEPAKGKVLSIEDVLGDSSMMIRENMQTQMELIRSRDVALRVAKRLKLWEHPSIDPRVEHADTSLFGRISQKIGLGKGKGAEGPARQWTENELLEMSAAIVRGGISVAPVRLSLLLKISFDSGDSELAGKLANAVAEEYIEYDLDTRYQMTRGASDWLQQRLGTLRDKLNASEQQLQAYRDSRGLVEVKASAQSGAGRQLDEVTGKLVEARVKRAEAETAYNQIKAVPKGGDLTAIPAIVRNPLVTDALRQKADAERKLAELSQRYGTEHPKYVQATSELQSAKENLRRQVDTVAATVTRDYENAIALERAMSSAVATAKAGIQDINRKEFQLSVLEREVDSNKQIYEMFVKRQKETNLTSDLQTPVARIVDRAERGYIVGPDVRGNASMAFLVGAVLGIFMALFIERLDNTIKTTEDVETRLKHPLLTSLPLLSGDESQGGVARMFLDKPQSLYAESIRTARTGVLLSAIDLPNRLLLVTSSLPGEGKSTFCVNLALAHAHTKKTLLIDADMRRPSIAKHLGMEAGAKGLSNLVSGTVALKDCVHSLPDTNLMVIPAGNIPPNPLELLLSERFKQTLDKLSSLFEIIIVDSPPVELVSDSMVIAPQVTGVIYLVKAEDTPYQLARKGLARIRKAQGNVLGVVLNRLDFVKAERYYGEYSGYGKYGYSRYGYSRKMAAAMGKSGYAPYQTAYGAENQETGEKKA